MSDYAKWQTKKKCPKCGSKDFQVDEYVEITNKYTAEGGIITFEGTSDFGDTKAIYCKCHKCGYTWHPRRDLFIEPIN